MSEMSEIIFDPSLGRMPTISFNYAEMDSFRTLVTHPYSGYELDDLLYHGQWLRYHVFQSVAFKYTYICICISNQGGIINAVERCADRARAAIYWTPCSEIYRFPIQIEGYA